MCNNMNYFTDCKCIEEVKEIYRKMACLLHPDINHAPDATQQMQALNSQYEHIFALLKNTHRSINNAEEVYTATGDKETKEVPEDFIGIISVIIGLVGIKIELMSLGLGNR